MRKSFLYLPILFVLILAVISCSKTAVDPTPTDNLTKSWSVSIAQEGGTIVYQKGGSSNTVPGYSGYRLSLAAASIATLTAVDGNTFTGTWALSSDNKTLTLTNLNNAGQAPTGYNPAGTIVYNILSTITATTVTLETAQKDPKAGGKTVNLQLVNP